jgi:para-aminobenzoate synthetase/4-amino-4-deoxychorismate lyase
LIRKDDVLLKHEGKWLHFAQPRRVISATNLHEVRAALQEVEELVNSNGWHAAGFVSYEAAPAFDDALQVQDARDFPLLWFGLYTKPRVLQLPALETSHTVLEWKPSTRRESYNTAIEKIKDHIARGRTYQVNYTMSLRAAFENREWELFLSMAQNQNKYAAYIDTGRYVICSASPELFFELDGETITGQPMKGTIARGRTTEEDRQQAERLQNSAKDRAENVMIVDLIRNDIGRVAEIGSVNVPELFSVEKFATLFQMTSTVQAKTRASVAEIFDALFPCGSITGAPKVSTMKIISELEPTPRKIYTGSIGYISPGRKAQFNVAIRTVLVDRQTKSAEYGVGGGIVWDSTQADEYDEALLKARVLTERTAQFSLLETILWTPEEGYFLLEKHIARMQDSAVYFEFEFSEKEVRAALSKLSKTFKASQRIRMLLDRSGNISTQATPFQLHETSFLACLAAQPVDSKDVFLYHKTTQRETYDKALVVPQIHNDVLLYNEKDELTEFTIGNLVVDLNGEMITPPVSCGLLAGTFRAHLLETGKIKERVIHKGQLPLCKEIFLVNSVRKWVEVKV